MEAVGMLSPVEMKFQKTWRKRWAVKQGCVENRCLANRFLLNV
jgi:hypothetical protein